jgi:hypothetical protein
MVNLMTYLNNPFTWLEVLKKWYKKPRSFPNSLEGREAFPKSLEGRES